MGKHSHLFIAKRAAQELQNGFYVVLGAGIPKLVLAHIPKGADVMVLSENGLLGLGPRLQAAEVVPDLTDAQKEIAAAVSGSSCFSSADSFAMIRGSHIDLAILDALEVDEKGNLANWMIPGQMIKGMGAAMDIATGARRLVVAMEHRTKEKKIKILRDCTLPLTGLGVVSRIITEMAVIDVSPDGLVLREIAPGLSVDEVSRATEAGIKVDKDVKIIQV